MSIAGALLARGGFRLYVNDYHGHVVRAAGVEGSGDQASGRLFGVARASARISPILASGTMSERPSEHRRKRSPASTGRTAVSTSTSSSAPRARVMRFFWGCSAAWSLVRSPLRTSSATSEWSSVTGLKLAAAQQVRPRVSDVRDLGHRLIAGAAEAHGDDGRPHPGEPLVAPAGGEDPAVRLPYGGLEGGSGLEALEHVYGDAARHLPGSKPPMPSATANSVSSRPSPTSSASSLLARTFPASVAPKGSRNSIALETTLRT